MKRDKKLEAEFEDKHILGVIKRTGADHFYPQIMRTSEEDWSFAQMGDLQGKRILVYGSGGYSSLTTYLAQRGATVIAIDISQVAVEKIESKAVGANLKGQIYTLRMDAEALAFQAGSFDIVYARSIIHHLDIGTSKCEICRVLKEGRTAICIEPLGENPIINLFRRLTPHIRTPDEQPLNRANVREFLSVFTTHTARYCYLTVLPLLATHRLIPNGIFERCFYACDWIDQKLFRWIPGLRKFAWVIMLSCVK